MNLLAGAYREVLSIHSTLLTSRGSDPNDRTPDNNWRFNKAKGGGSGDSGAWREDPAEKARRFWLRWREWCYPTQRFAHFATAVRLVVLVQPSSAAIERWFSQLKLIVEETGCAIVSDLLRLRMFMRCNRKVYEILDIVVV